ncbi:MAG: hypothetical protein VW872_02865, partial [Candidatus Poseidoniales archaeon]
LVLLAAVLLGYSLVMQGPADPGQKLFAAAVASSLSAGVLLMLSWHMSEGWALVRGRQDDWALALLGTAFVVVGLVSGTAWWVLGLPLFLFTPRGWQAVRSTLD